MYVVVFNKLTVLIPSYVLSRTRQCSS